MHQQPETAESETKPEADAEGVPGQGGAAEGGASDDATGGGNNEGGTAAGEQ